jgi:hypothetical protein
MLRIAKLFTIIAVRVYKEKCGLPYIYMNHIVSSRNAVSETYCGSRYSTKM